MPCFVQLTVLHIVEHYEHSTYPKLSDYLKIEAHLAHEVLESLECSKAGDVKGRLASALEITVCVTNPAFDHFAASRGLQ